MYTNSTAMFVGYFTTMKQGQVLTKWLIPRTLSRVSSPLFFSGSLSTYPTEKQGI